MKNIRLSGFVLVVFLASVMLSSGIATGETPTPAPSPTPNKSDRRGVVLGGSGLIFSIIGSYHRAPDEQVKNLVGFDAGLFYNVKRSVGVGGEFSGVFGSNTTGTVDTSLHRFMYLVGPQFNVYPNDKTRVFFHPLFGGVHDTGTTTIGTTSFSSSANAFAMAFGGGVDVAVSKRVAVRVIQADYVPTHFGGAWQNNFRLSAGIVIGAGKKE